MRDPKRISRICRKIESLWHQNPDLRLGQLLINVEREADQGGLWDIEDSVWERKLAQALKKSFEDKAEAKRVKAILKQVEED